MRVDDQRFGWNYEAIIPAIVVSAGHRIWLADKRKSVETQPVSGSLFGLRLDVGWIEIGNFADLMRQ